jgi:HEAT repeat protein
MRKLLAITVLLLSSAGTVLAQKPNITNAKIQESSAAAGLKPAIDSILAAQAGPLWIGYRIPAASKERTMCCWESVNQSRSAGKCCLGCKMDSEHGGNFSGTDSNCASPEPLPYAFVFLRAETRQITKTRVFSADCPLDFAGLPLYWLEQVKPEQSIDLLLPLAQSTQEDGSYRRDLSHQAVMAIAMHNVPAADQALEKLIQAGQPLRLRENVAFWLGVERGKAGLDLLRKYSKEDQDDRFRERVTFAISQSKEPDAIKDLIAMARSDSSPRVRGQALFWMAQIGGRKAAEQITAAIENDPETEVKRKAVFALSQLHDGEGVPMLINVARTNRNAAVRKQAIFWLGQSHDPRALDFLEELLTK